MRFFIFLFLLPHLLFCLDKQKAEKLYYESFAHWNKYHEYLQELNKIDSEADYDHFMQVLDLACESCRKAVESCNVVINDISKKDKKGNKRIWHYDLHEDCKKAKRVFKPEFEKIQNLVEQSLSRQKALSLIKEFSEMAKPAYAKYHEHPQVYPDLDKLIATLEEARVLFESVLHSLVEAISSINYPVMEIDAKKIKTYQADYEGAIKTIDIHVEDWKKIKDSTREEQIKLLNLTSETQKLFDERDLKNLTFETLLKMFALLEKLSENSFGEEKDFVDNHLLILRKYFKLE